MKNIIIALFVLLPFCIYPQKDLRPGYIITLDNDTVYGQIDYRGSFFMSQICRFLTDEGMEEFNPYQITAYRFIDSKYYVSKRVNNDKRFLEFLVEGKLNIYYSGEDGDHYFIEKEGEPLKEIPFKENDIITVRGKEYLKGTTNHIGFLNYYTRDRPDLHPQIRRIKELEHSNLIELAREYHNLVCEDGEECVVYEKKLPAVRVNLELTGGIYSFYNGKSFDSPHFLSGLSVHIWLPRTSEKLFFRTGINYASFTVQKRFSESEPIKKPTFLATNNNRYKYTNVLPQNSAKVYKVIKIPVYFEYQYPRGIFRPSASYGINYYYPAFISSGFSIGLDIEMNKYINFSIDYGLEFDPFIFIFPSKYIFGQSLSMGYYIKL